MPKLKYTGPIDEVEVEGIVVTRNVPVAIPSAIAGRPVTEDDPGEGLLSQSTWELVKTRGTEDES